MEDALDQNIKMYIYLSSTDSPVHSQNTQVDFIVELPLALQLDGNWECALMDINRHNVLVYCDWCQESVIHGALFPVLRKVNNKDIVRPRYVPIYMGDRRRFRIYIKDLANKTPSFGNQPTMCTLHLRRLQ